MPSFFQKFLRCVNILEEIKVLLRVDVKTNFVSFVRWRSNALKRSFRSQNAFHINFYQFCFLFYAITLTYKRFFEKIKVKIVDNTFLLNLCVTRSSKSSISRLFTPFFRVFSDFLHMRNCAQRSHHLLRTFFLIKFFTHQRECFFPSPRSNLKPEQTNSLKINSNFGFPIPSLSIWRLVLFENLLATCKFLKKSKSCLK